MLSQRLLNGVSCLNYSNLYEHVELSTALGLKGFCQTLLLFKLLSRLKKRTAHTLSLIHQRIIQCSGTVRHFTQPR